MKFVDLIERLVKFVNYQRDIGLYHLSLELSGEPVVPASRQADQIYVCVDPFRII
jgi:hypothetical protein